MIQFTIKKVISMFLILILVVNIGLFAFRMSNPTIFWIILGVIAFLSYVVMPRMKFM